MTLSSIPEAIEHIRAGGCVIVVDDEDRENEGDLIMAAEHASASTIGFFVRHTSGVICMATTGERLVTAGAATPYAAGAGGGS